jgi:hypothetical protein
MVYSLTYYSLFSSIKKAKDIYLCSFYFSVLDDVGASDDIMQIGWIRNNK